MKHLKQSEIKPYREANKPRRCPILMKDNDDWNLDHAHPNCGGNGMVRGVISASANTLLGKIENHYHRFVRSKTHLPLPDVLRRCADYLERDTGILHPVGIRELVTVFKQLPSSDQVFALKALGVPEKDVFEAKNSLQRAKLYRKFLVK